MEGHRTHSSKCDSSIKWTKEYPMKLLEESNDSPWQFVGKNGSKGSQQHNEVQTNPGNKCKLAVMLNAADAISSKGTKHLRP